LLCAISPLAVYAPPYGAAALCGGFQVESEEGLSTAAGAEAADEALGVTDVVEAALESALPCLSILRFLATLSSFGSRAFFSLGGFGMRTFLKTCCSG
jgi:hypothetical protein